METMTTTPAPPDWATLGRELACPLCGYNLRGLAEPRCPECGFAFGWAELLDENRDRHPWLFEHARRRRGRAFVATYFRTCRPRWFWREVTPANPVHVGRLVVYWAITCLLLAAAAVASVPGEAVGLARDTASARSAFAPVPGSPGLYQLRGRPSVRINAIQYARYQAQYPPPLSWAFARAAWEQHWRRDGAAWFGLTAVVAAWPWMSAAALLVFQASMRRAKVNPAHVLRVAVYGCDFGLLMVAAAAAFALWLYWTVFNARPEPGPFVAVAPLACAAVATYRLRLAYGRYLRFHLPLATVLASQVMVLLLVFAVMLQIAEWD